MQVGRAERDRLLEQRVDGKRGGGCAPESSTGASIGKVGPRLEASSSCAAESVSATSAATTLYMHRPATEANHPPRLACSLAEIAGVLTKGVTPCKSPDTGVRHRSQGADNAHVGSTP